MSSYQRYQEILDHIQNRAGGRNVLCIAVSKRQPTERVESFLKEGGRVFGENSLQESIPKFTDFKTKYPELASEMEVHHIGPVQTGTLRKLFGNFQFTHGVGSQNVLNELYKRSLKESSKLGYFLQINTTDEAQKNGFSLKDAKELLQNLNLYQNEQLFCAGLMTMGPTDENPDSTREAFRELRKLRDSYFPMGKLSMGMSGDYPIALDEGSDIIRVGSAIFGER